MSNGNIPVKSLANRTAVLIEDDENNRVLMQFILEEHGCRVCSANTGRGGLELVNEIQPDFVVLDIQLPDIEGTEVLYLMRRSEAWRIPVLAATSYAMSGDRERLLAHGCNRYVEKPIDPDTIIDEILGMLEESQ